MVTCTMMSRRILLFAVVLSSLAARPAHASFHLIQIEQVIGGVHGDLTAQAIQLRMRSLGQNLVSQARLIVRDAAGANPVTVINMTTNVTNGAAGSRVLVASSAFLTYLPAVTPDFVMTNVIPASYLAAGTLTWENDSGTIYWRLSWGGASYTGPGTGVSTLNDADGNSNPPFAGPLPSAGTQVLLFGFAASAASTNNANDYALTPGAVTFVNNAGASASIDVDSDGVPTVTDNCPNAANANQADDDVGGGDGRGNMCDNCRLTANNGQPGTGPAQNDANGDGFGNICDGDLNDTGLTTSADNTILRNVLNLPASASAAAAAADMNGSGTVTSADNTLLRNRLNTAPGPGAGP